MSDEPRTTTPQAPPKTTRRTLLKRAALGALACAGAGAAYPVLEAKWCELVRRDVTIPNLPASLRGAKLAFLADLHYGPFTPLAYLRHVIERTNALAPDLVVLGGDYVTRFTNEGDSICDAMAGLRARLGRFAVLGNHDHAFHDGGAHAARIRRRLENAGIEMVENRGGWIDRDDGRLRVCGVGDLWMDRQDLYAALGDARTDDAVILVSHNPDFAEYGVDSRVGLMLSGHTHGGQVVVPGYGPPMVPSRFGRKYLGGLVDGPSWPVYVSRGVGTSGPPVRLFCPPEIVLLTLT